MEEFDNNMTEFSPFTWQPVYSDGSAGELMDFSATIEQQNNLSSSRGILETIVEETSDDEDNHFSGKWSRNSDSFSSGSSETGSVVRVDVVQEQDNDAMSERDFICPPKRRRQEFTEHNRRLEMLEHQKLEFIPTSALFSNLLSMPGSTSISSVDRSSNDNTMFESYFMKQNDLRFRFDELGVEPFSDSDRLSYTSLSRSSSLIQFESLERQMLNDSQISGSSPSIYSQLSYEGIGATITSASGTLSLNIPDIIEKTAAISIILPTIKITNPLPTSGTYNNSDSEPFSSSPGSSGSFSSDESESNNEIKVTTDVTANETVTDSSLSSTSSSNDSTKPPPNNCMTKTIENRQKSLNYKTKNSVDSLSEDSGYCDRDIGSGRITTATAALCLDSSMPTGNDLEDEDGSVIEEKSILRNLCTNNHSEMENLFLENKPNRTRFRQRSNDDDDICYHSMENLNRKQRRIGGHSREEALLSSINVDSSIVINYNTITQSNNNNEATAKQQKCSSAQSKIESTKLNHSNEHQTMPLRVKNNTVIRIHEKLSTSTPELYTVAENKSQFKRLLKRNYSERSHDQLKDFCVVSSVPDYINLLSVNRFGSDSNSINGDYNWPPIVVDSVANKNFNLYEFYGHQSAANNLINKIHTSVPSVVRSRPVDISASCANLTLLNYSDCDDDDHDDEDDEEFCGYESIPPVLIQNSAKRIKRMHSNSSDDDDDDDDDVYMTTYKNKELSSLLEEISAHFDKNLSILNDREVTYDPKIDYHEMEAKELKKEEQQRARMPPIPPPRRTGIKTSPNHSGKSQTFDRDPTNLSTCYTESLERCNFDINEPINVYSSRHNLNAEGVLMTNNEQMEHSTPIKKRDFVSSTPNLNYFDIGLRHTTHHYNSTENAAASHQLNPFTTDDENRCTSMKEIANSRSGSTGILSHSSAGSKSGLSKGVSFCPIVSEISWQVPMDDEDEEMAEEIDFNPHGNEQYALRNDSLVNYYQQTYSDDDDEDDDEEEDFDDTIAVGTSTTQATIENNNDRHTTLQSSPTPTPPQILTNEIKTITDETLMPDRDGNIEETLMETTNIVELISCSNNNLIASNSKKMYTEAKTTSSANESFIAAESTSTVPVAYKKSSTLTMTGKSANPNEKAINNDTINNGGGGDGKSAKIKSDNKKSNKTFFSRLSSGLRFSFRNKSKKSTKTNGVVNYQIVGNNNNNNNNNVTTTTTTNTISMVPSEKKQQQKSDKTKALQHDPKSSDFIFIPLKDPNDNLNNFDTVDNCMIIDEQQQQQQLHNDRDNNNEMSTFGRQSPGKMNRAAREVSPNVKTHGMGNHVLIGKPPLPKQPPRIVGVCAKQQQQQLQQQQQNRRSTTHAPRASSTPREIDGEYHHNTIAIGDSLKHQYYGGTSPASKMNGGGGSKIGLIETNLDTDETIINGKTQSLLELGIGQQNGKGMLNRSVGMSGGQVLNNCNNVNNGSGSEAGRPHKSMEFLLDKENHRNVLPPENELQKARESNATLSEHQLRVQASLQRLNIPDWYKNYSGGSGQNTSANTSYYKQTGADVTGLLRKRNSDMGRWTGLNSKTTSLSSLGSNKSDRSPVMLSPSAHSHHGQTGFSRWSTSHLNSNQTSPSVSARSSFVRNNNYNSSTMSGQSVTSAGSGQGTVTQTNTIRNSFRQPYLGWRSQEKLSQPRTPAERLASSLKTEAQQKQLENPIATHEIQSSIKEVTSAIVHYVNDQTNRGSRSRSVSPSTRCWLESSFVGTKPLESPQTPMMESSFTQHHPQHRQINIGPMSSSNYDTIRINGVADSQQSPTNLPYSFIMPERSPSSTTLEDVLSSLLGLNDCNSHRPSTEDLANQQTNRGTTSFSTFKPPQSQQMPVNNNNNNNNNKVSSTQLTVESSMHSRRHSEGDAQQKRRQAEELKQQQQQLLDEQTDEIKPLTTKVVSLSTSSPQPRRVSLDSTDAKRGDLLKCRYPKCDNAATQADAKKTYKQCHNCSHLYCSRDCRRSHWEKGHRRACLHSRVSAICRQVLSTCKDDQDTLKHLSLLARRGFIAQGRGIVRLLFRSPENADLFIKQGFQCIGEVSYVRWPDLLPAEMGPELYSELLRLSTEYKTETKMLIYVAICVVSEAPSSSTAPVKWERQLVSRCAKLKLCKTILKDTSLFTDKSSTTNSQIVKHEFNTDVLILTFNVNDKFTQKSREMILANVLETLGKKGINLRKHHPEVYQRLSNYVEGLSERFLPVTIHPRDNTTGRSFVCIIMPINGDTEKIKLPKDGRDRVQTIDVGQEHMVEEDDMIGTKF